MFYIAIILNSLTAPLTLSSNDSLSSKVSDVIPLVIEKLLIMMKRETQVKFIIPTINDAIEHIKGFVMMTEENDNSIINEAVKMAEIDLSKKEFILSSLELQLYVIYI